MLGLFTVRGGDGDVMTVVMMRAMLCSRYADDEESIPFHTQLTLV